MGELVARAEEQIARFMEAGFSRSEAIVEYVNSLPGDTVSYAEVEEYNEKHEQGAQANGHGEPAPLQLAPPRRRIDWSALQGKSPPERVWLINHWLGVGATLLAGPGGTGKTLVAQTIATAIALGKAFLDEIPKAANVLMWACEDDHDELWRRQLAICRHFGVQLGALPAGYVVEHRLGLGNALAQQSYGALAWTNLLIELKEQINDYHADVVVLDNIGQVFGGNENDRHHVTEFLNTLQGLSERQVAIILLGHPAKIASSEYSGSTAWQNAVRMRWFMGDQLPDQKQSEDEEAADPNVRYITKRKANYTIHDFRKLVWTNGLYVPEAPPLHTFQEKYGRRGDAAEAVLLGALDRLNGNGVRSTASHASSDYLPKVVASSGLAQGFTRQELAAALSRLRAGGKITEVAVGKYPNRAPKYGLSRSAA